MMHQRLTPSTIALLTLPPLLWAGNAVVGRLVHDMVPPMALNFIRWLLAFALLLPFAGQVLRRDSPLWPHWRRYALLGLLGVGVYNAAGDGGLRLASGGSVVVNINGAGDPDAVGNAVVSKLRQLGFA